MCPQTVSTLAVVAGEGMFTNVMRTLSVPIQLPFFSVRVKTYVPPAFAVTSGCIELVGLKVTPAPLHCTVPSCID